MNFFGFYVLNFKPTILAYLTSSNGKMYEAPEWLRPIAVIEHIPWWHGSVITMLKRKAKQIDFTFKGIEHHLMVHARDEEAMRIFCSVRGAFISQNIYISEDIFHPLNIEKMYDAIYIAQPAKFKRHELAKLVKRLYVVLGGGNLRSFCPEIAHAEHSEKRLEKTDVAKMINHSYCSLALSKVEGAMLASFESLLCGVPVVTTPSKGGRDEFLDTYNSVLVQPDAQVVAAAVEKLKSYPPDPQIIRAKALEQLTHHRQSFCQYVARLIERHGGNKVTSEQLYDRYFNCPGGISSRFVWADKLDDPKTLEKVQNSFYTNSRSNM